MPSNKKRSGGKTKEFLLSGIMLILIAAGLLAIARHNDIRSFEDYQNYAVALSYNFEECVPFFGSGDCNWRDERFRSGEGNSGGNNGNDDSSEDDNENGGSDSNGSVGIDELGVDTQGSRDEATVSAYWEQLDQIDVSEPDTDIDYDRTEYRHWITIENGCNTRNTVLIQQGENVETGDGCRIESGTWFDPFTAETTDDSSSLDIDHIVPLGYAAAHGADAFDDQRKEDFANDFINLRAVSASENRSKGADGPANYMPPNEDFHCEYAQIWIDTLAEYELSIESDDKVEVERALNTC